MSLLTTILVSSAAGAVISSILNFFFQLHFENRKSKERDKLEVKENDKEIIEKLYGPIYSILGEDIYPGDGYEGIDPEQLDRIRTLIEKYPHLVDSELDGITYSYLEDIAHIQLGPRDLAVVNITVDSNRKLFYYVLRIYNQKKKNLNLPFDETHIKKI